MKPKEKIETVFLADCEQHLLCYNSLENIDYTTLQERIHEALKRLTARERAVICRRFGLYHFKPETCKSIARTIKNVNSGKVGVSLENVRRIEGRALRKVRLPANSY